MEKNVPQACMVEMTMLPLERHAVAQELAEG
jgi:hypothetical protein